jgi:hypothetical protein
MNETTNGAAPEPADGPARRWIARGAIAFYVATVTGAIVLLVVIGETGLAIWLGAVEVASVVALAVVERRPRRRPVGPDGVPRRTTRLGTPLDPGMPSGRREPPRRLPAPVPARQAPLPTSQKPSE